MKVARFEGLQGDSIVVVILVGNGVEIEATLSYTQVFGPVIVDSLISYGTAGIK